MAEIQPTDVFFIPNRRRLTHTIIPGPAGQQELHIFYGPKEIIIDEPDLMSFGNTLMKIDKFKAEDARSWSAEAPYDWERVRGLLEALVSEEILKRFDATAAAAATARTFPPTLGRPGAGRQPETWSAHEDKCPVMTKRMLGRPVDLSNLEVVFPIFRVAHPAVDQDGRQVGENNVADPLFLDLPTERRLCNYAGSRYHADTPINSTALKHMVRRWPELLSLTEQYRTAFFKRLPPQNSSLVAGEVHLLAVGCLSAVGYVMVRGEAPVPNGKLDPGLAAMFRLIDGVRIVTTQMVRDTAGTHGCDRTVNAKIIHDYAEHYSLFIDTWGVCAGPAALIDEYMQVLLDNVPAPIQANPDVGARVGDLDAALDYGFHGIRVEALVRASGAMQGFLHERLRLAYEKHLPAAPTKMQELLKIPIDHAHYPFLRADHPPLETMEMEVRVGRWLFARARAGLPPEFPGALESLDEIRRIDLAAKAEGQRKLGEFLGAVPEYASLPEPLREELVAISVESFALDRAVLRATTTEQQRLNERLRRKPGPPLTGDDLAHYERRATPVYARVLGEGLGVSITSDVGSTVVAHGQRSVTLAD